MIPESHCASRLVARFLGQRSDAFSIGEETALEQSSLSRKGLHGFVRIHTLRIVQLKGQSSSSTDCTSDQCRHHRSRVMSLSRTTLNQNYDFDASRFQGIQNLF